MSLAVWPDPREYRHSLPGTIWRDYEYGVISRADLWQRLIRLWGEGEVRRLVAGEAAESCFEDGWPT